MQRPVATATEKRNFAVAVYRETRTRASHRPPEISQNAGFFDLYGSAASSRSAAR
jgi:hypothetical protein